MEQMLGLPDSHKVSTAVPLAWFGVGGGHNIFHWWPMPRVWRLFYCYHSS